MTLEVRKTGAVETARKPSRPVRVRAALTNVRVRATIVTRRHAWTTWRVTRQLPVLSVLLVAYSPRGLSRLVAAWVRYLRDEDTATLRAQHAASRESGDYVKVSSVRSSNLAARLLASGLAVLGVVVLVLAWVAPDVLGVFVGAGVFYGVVRAVPKRDLNALLGAAVAGVAAYFATPWAAGYLPVPPMWLWWLLGGLGVGVCGWVGRPRAKQLVAIPGYQFGEPSMPAKPTAEMVVEALCRIGVPGMTLAAADRVRDEIRVVAPGVATSANGYIVELELPPGNTSEEVVARRAPLAGALRRDLACVWPSGNPNKHPGYLRLFLSHQPMNRGRQPPWPVAAGKPIDIFEAIPLFTDEEMRWVSLTLAGTHAAVGGASGFGKSVWLRSLAIAVAFDIRVQLIVFDGKRAGDLECVRRLCHGYHVGSEPEEIEQALGLLRELVRERNRRSRFLQKLPPGEKSNKVTSALASKYKELRPIVVLLDEVQEYTEYGTKDNKAEMKIRAEFIALLTKLSRLARAAGIILVFCSQKPDANVLPSAIMGNCAIRVAFKVSEQTHNDQILGTSARKNGVDATMFTTRDRGMAWLRGGDDVDAQVVRSWSALAEDVALADELGEKAYQLRKAAGMLTGDAAGEGDKEEEVVIDIAADVRRVLTERNRPAGQHVELVEWLQELRPAHYAALDVEELSASLRARGLMISQVKSRGRNLMGIDLRKQAPATTDD